MKLRHVLEDLFVDVSSETRFLLVYSSAAQVADFGSLWVSKEGLRDVLHSPVRRMVSQFTNLSADWVKLFRRDLEEIVNSTVDLDMLKRCTETPLWLLVAVSDRRAEDPSFWERRVSMRILWSGGYALMTLPRELLDLAGELGSIDLSPDEVIDLVLAANRRLAFRLEEALPRAATDSLGCLPEVAAVHIRPSAWQSGKVRFFDGVEWLIDTVLVAATPVPQAGGPEAKDDEASATHSTVEVQKSSADDEQSWEPRE